jgi:hypothetical protein
VSRFFCETCLWVLRSYDPDHPAPGDAQVFLESLRDHEQVHDCRRGRLAQLGLQPFPPEHREWLLSEGNRLLSLPDLEVQLIGAEMIIDSGFARSVERLLDDNAVLEHPRRGVYASMLDLHRHFPDLPVADALRAKYGTCQGPVIDYWTMLWGVSPLWR